MDLPVKRCANCGGTGVVRGSLGDKPAFAGCLLCDEGNKIYRVLRAIADGDPVLILDATGHPKQPFFPPSAIIAPVTR